jgi:chitinase
MWKDLTNVLFFFFYGDHVEQTVDGRGDPWSDNDASNLFGNFKQLYLLKQRYRHLKVSLSIGGWTWSTNFAGVAADPSKRAIFVRSAVQHLGDLGLDGIGRNI